jgi:hypothetical protein
MFDKYLIVKQYKQVLSWTAFLSYLPVSTLRGATPHLNFAYALLYFSGISDADKFLFLFSNGNVFNIVAKTCYNILIRIFIPLIIV